MNKQRKLIALVLVLLLLVSSLAACVPGPARKPAPYGANNYNPGMNTPYTARSNNQNYNNYNANNTNGNQTTSLFSKLDYSFASVLSPNSKVWNGLSTDTPVIDRLNSGEKVKVIGKLNGLYVIQLPDSNKLGTIAPDLVKLYSAMPGSTVPAPTKPIPTTPATTGTGRIGAGTTGTGITGNVGNAGAPRTIVTPGATGTTGLNQNVGTTRNTTPPTAANTPTATGTGTLTADASRILQLCNAERAKVGAKPLKANTDLTKLANMKSQDIVQKNYFSHQSPTYGSPFDMMKTYGISYMYAGENLAINQSADGAHNAWMNSEGHKRNILNPDFTEIGIGIYPKGNGSYAYTQMFIGR